MIDKKTPWKLTGIHCGDGKDEPFVARFGNQFHTGVKLIKLTKITAKEFHNLPLRWSDRDLCLFDIEQRRGEKEFWVPPQEQEDHINDVFMTYVESYKALCSAAHAVFVGAHEGSDLTSYDNAYKTCGNWAILRDALETSKKELGL